MTYQLLSYYNILFIIVVESVEMLISSIFISLLAKKKNNSPQAMVNPCVQLIIITVFHMLS